MDLTAEIFNNEDAAREHLESLRWPNGPYCPHCGERENHHRLEGKTTRKGLFYCRACRGQFSVTVGSVFERSHIPLHKWVLATYLLTSSKKGMSAHQLHRTLGVTYKTAWFMAHRIREAMTDKSGSGPLGGAGKTVEADETYVGPAKSEFRNGAWHYKQGVGGKRAVVTLVERGGRARSIHFDRIKLKDVREFVVTNADRASHLRTDESPLYTRMGREFASHKTVNHSKKEYVRGDASTNTAEGYFSIFKRGMRGVYQHCGEQHLQRYLNEFDFRYSHRIALGVDDWQRGALALKGISGKRLTYRRTNEKEAQG